MIPSDSNSNFVGEKESEHESEWDNHSKESVYKSDSESGSDSEFKLATIDLTKVHKNATKTQKDKRAFRKEVERRRRLVGEGSNQKARYSFYLIDCS